MAVYTTLSDTDVRNILKLYDLPPLLRVEPIHSGVSNTNYKLHLQDRLAVLTILEKGESLSEAEFVINFMTHCRDYGILSPLTYPSKEGKTVIDYHGKPLLICSFLYGEEGSIPNPDQCRSGGNTLGMMHLHAKNFAHSKPNTFNLKRWDRVIDQCGKDLNDIQKGLEKELKAEMAYLKEHWPQNLPSGVGFLDFFPNNVFFVGNQVSGVIDFYFSATDAFAFDFMIGLNAWCFDPPAMTFDPQKAKAFIEGYAAKYTFTPEERTALPVLARGAVMRFLSQRSFDWLYSRSTGNKQHDPLEYYRLLKFYQKDNAIQKVSL